LVRAAGFEPAISVPDYLYVVRGHAGLRSHYLYSIIKELYPKGAINPV